MTKITEVSVDLTVVVIRHLDEAYGPRAAGPALTKVLDLLGQAEALYQTLPRVTGEGD